MSVPLLDIPLRASRIYVGIMCLLYGMTALLLFVAPLSIVLKLTLFAGLFWLCWQLWREWQVLESVQRLQVMPQNCRLITAHGDLELTVGRQTLVTSKLVILDLRSAGQTLRLPLLPDMAAADDLRRLRVWLRCQR